MSRSVFRQFLYICKSGHLTKSLQWHTVKSVKCDHCRRRAYMSIYGTAERYHTAAKQVYFENSTGEVYFPGSPTDQPPAGFEVKVIENFVQRDRFYRKMNAQIKLEHEQYIGQEQASYQKAMTDNHSELRRMMDQGVPVLGDDGQPTGATRPMTELEKDMARTAMDSDPRAIRAELEAMAKDNPRIAEKLAQADKVRSRPLSERFYHDYDPGFYAEAWEMDKSNRRPYNNDSTGWRDQY